MDSPSKQEEGFNYYKDTPDGKKDPYQGGPSGVNSQMDH